MREEGVEIGERVIAVGGRRWEGEGCRESYLHGELEMDVLVYFPSDVSGNRGFWALSLASDTIRVALWRSG